MAAGASNVVTPLESDECEAVERIKLTDCRRRQWWSGKETLKSKAKPVRERGAAVRVQRMVSRLDAMLEMWEAAWLYLVQQKQDFDGAAKIRPIKSGLQELKRDVQSANAEVSDSRREKP